ncbi:DUF6152 family protein [Gammaproteobacteria bacterium]|nr:DUF6152 family protein [Gammaproteobacteria bacterium]MDC0598437.1 DUF6152 family protein [Gammaproteobacteria bacterium]
MKSLLLCVLTVSLFAAAVFTSNTSAHHSFAVFDFETQIPFEGTVESIKFRNPHIEMMLKTTDMNGEEQLVHFIEGAPANMLVRSGLRPSMVQPGSRITGYGSPLISDPTKFFLRKIVLENGDEY